MTYGVGLDLILRLQDVTLCPRVFPFIMKSGTCNRASRTFLLARIVKQVMIGNTGLMRYDLPVLAWSCASRPTLDLGLV